MRVATILAILTALIFGVLIALQVVEHNHYRATVLSTTGQ